MKLKTIVCALLLTFIFSCKSDDTDELTLSGKKEVTSFNLSGVNATVNESSKTITVLVEATDLTALSPTIIISPKATISPDSGVQQDFSTPVDYTVTAEDKSIAKYVVTVTSSIHKFMYDGKKYEIVMKNEDWFSSASFAAQRGGYLAEINDVEEQNAIFTNLKSANISAANTIAPDGGGASYVWIGGNDVASEGDWVWDGNNDGTSSQFWKGKSDGNAVDSLYNNWGNEPDDFGTGQDGLGLAITDWPLGVAGQWNDVDHTNQLFFVIEFD